MTDDRTIDLKTLDRLLLWLACYVIVLVSVCAMAGLMADIVPILTHLISGFSGAAFAIMRATADKKEAEK